MSARWADKRLIAPGEPAERDEEDPSLALGDGDELLGAACAWLCVAVSALIITVALVRWAWVVIFG